MINNDTAVFLSAVTMRTSHYAHMSRVFEESIEYSRGCLVSSASAKEIRSKQCFFHLSGAFFLVEWTVKGKRNIL